MIDLSDIPNAPEGTGIDLSDIPNQQETDSDMKYVVEKISQDGDDGSLWDRFWRTFEPDWEQRRARSAISLEAARETGLPPSAFEPPLTDAVKAGFQSSVIGLQVRGKLPEEIIPEEAMKYLPAAKRIAMQAATLAGDFPYMVAGAMLGTGGGPPTQLGGAFALPAGLRQVYMDMYEKGRVSSAADFMERLWDATYETLKGEATGVTVGTAAGMVSSIARFPTEIATMVTVGSALEGKLPEPHDFVDAAVVIGGMKASVHVSGKLRNIYAKTGRTPAEVIRDIEEDPLIGKDLLSEDRDIPEIYKEASKVPERKVIKVPKPRKPVDITKTKTFFGWAKTKGGIFDPSLPGEMEQFTTKESRAIGLISKKYGQPFDEMTRHAIADGWLKEGATIDDFIGLLNRDLNAIRTGAPRTMRLSETKAIKEDPFEWDRGDAGLLDYILKHPEEIEKVRGLDEEHRQLIREIQRDEGIKPGETKEIERGLKEEITNEIAFERGVTGEEVQRVLEEWDALMGEGRPLEAAKVVEKELGQQVDATIGEIKIPIGLSIKPIQGRTVPKKPTFEFSNTEIEARYRAAQGAKMPRVWDRIKESAVSLRNKITREYEHLPKTGFYAQLRFDLLRLSKGKGIASDRTLRNIQGITVNLDNAGYDLFTRKVILDDFVEMAKEGKPIPFGFTKKLVNAEITRLDSIIAENKPILEAMGKRDRLWKAIKADYIEAMKGIGFNVADKLQRKNYFRHQVLEYVNLKGLFGTGKRLRTPTARGFLKKRKGSELDINTDYLQAEHEVMAQMLYDIEVARVLRTVDKNYNIVDSLRKKAKKAKKAGKDLTWEDFIPDDYTVWQAREGNVFYMTDSIPAKLAEQLTSGALESLEITSEQIRKTLAVGGKRKQMVIPHRAAETLDALAPEKSSNVIAQAHREIIRLWKIWQLVSPRRYAKYNFRNLTGDADAMFAGNPVAFKKVPRAIDDLWQVFAGDKAMTDSLKDWFHRGGMQSTLQAQEMGELNKLKMFMHLKEQKGKATQIPLAAWQKYWRAARLSTDFREAILRYGAYLDYVEQMKKSPIGRPKNFGASIPEEVMGLKDIKDRAFMLSNDLLGAYDKIGIAGRALREHLWPFWSWKEVNFKRYVRMFRNAAADHDLTGTIGRKALGTIAATPFTAMRVGKFLLKATAFWSFLQVWNNTVFPDEENDLPDGVRTRPHIVLGRNEKGEVISFNRIGALGDFLEWFGLDAAPEYVNGWFQGKMSLQDIAVDMAKQPVNIVVQGGEPVIKLLGETLTRQSLFPDVFKPRTIRNRMLHLARSFGLENEYLAIADVPARPYEKSISGFFVYKTDPLQSAYGHIMNEQNRFMRKIGKYGEGFWITPRGNALYNARLALRYKEPDTAMKYMVKYLKMGGTTQGIKTSLERMIPLSGMSKADKAQFVAQLTKRDREKLVQAFKFYAELLGGIEGG